MNVTTDVFQDHFCCFVVNLLSYISYFSYWVSPYSFQTNLHVKWSDRCVYIKVLIRFQKFSQCFCWKGKKGGRI